MTIHFVGLFSEKKDAIPILLIHGWPGEIQFLCYELATGYLFTHQEVFWNFSLFWSCSGMSIHQVPCLFI